eukprot:2632336-Ditylum_brightwellii.AAC.1
MSGGRQDLGLETKVVNMEIKMGIVKEKRGNNGQKRATMAKQGMTKEANTDKASTMETKAVTMGDKEAKLITVEAISMIQEEKSKA